MRSISFLLFLIPFFSVNVLSRNSHRTLDPVIYKHRHALTSLRKNATAFLDDGLEPRLEERGDAKYVFMHHIVGNTYPYTQSDWADDIRQIQAAGVDAVALNMGGDPWQRAQVASAYAAARGTSLKLFLSLDFTAMGCDLGDVVGRVNEFAAHPSQFRVGGRPMVSSFSGDCLGDSGWAALKAQTGAYVMPFIWGLEGQFGSWPSLDSWYCWGCAWPQGDADKSTADDDYYMSQLGSRFATTISNWMYTHYSYKNWYMRGDDWLINTRWEQLMEMRDKLTFVEMISWNDYGESHYFGPVKGAQPDGTTWTSGFSHQAWYDMSQYYITAFKTGAYPPVTEDVIYYWARTHPASAAASSDPLPRPTGFDWAEDMLWVVVFSTSPSTVTLTSGGSSQTFDNIGPGVNKLKIPLSAGGITLTMVRDHVTVINETPSDYTFVINPTLYNYNAYVGSAKGVTTPPTTTVSTATTASSTASSSSTSASPTTATTSPTTTASLPETTPSTTASPTTATTSLTTTSTKADPSPTTTSVSGTTWSYLGCYPDYSPRTLNNGIQNSISSQSVSACLSMCAGAGYAFGGTEYGVECWCSSQITSGTNPVDASECDMPCPGKADDVCGGGNRISLYSASKTTNPSSSISATATSAPATSPTSTVFSYYGCVAEGTRGSRRALTAQSYSRSDMTPDLCQSLCSGYEYAGVEFESECYCGNSLKNNGATGSLISSDSCNVPCAGDSAKMCGGSWVLSVYSKGKSPGGTSGAPTNGWSSAGCFVDSPDRILKSSYTSQAGMTTEKCVGICASRGHNIAATEFGQECLCGSKFYPTEGGGVPVDPSECNMPCDGNVAQSCGSAWRANVYTRPGSPPDILGIHVGIRT